MKQHALTVFRRPPDKLNCAQAVLAGYQAVTNDHSLSLISLKPAGAGRAPEGLCGALHAACLIAPAHAEELKRSFQARIGALHCSNIEKPCPECVTTACDLLEQNPSSAVIPPLPAS